MLTCTRRELLASFLGAPLLAACTPAPRALAGGFLGPDHALGHRLREGFSPEPSRTREVPILILGGGIAGLSAAWRLLRAGQSDFELLELEAAPGGTSRAGHNAISAFPWGAHYLPAPLPHARAARSVLLDLGLAERGPDGELAYDESQWVRAPQERLFMVDRWYEGLYPLAGASQQDVAELARFEAHVAELAHLHDSAGKRVFAVPLAAAGDPGSLAELDTITLADWLAREGYQSPRLRFLLEYGTRDDMCALLNETSAFAGLHYHAARSEERGASNFLTWPEGNGRLAARLAGLCSRQLRTGVLVTGLAPLPDARWEVRTFEPQSGRCEALRARHVIAALPDAVLARVLPEKLERPSLAAQGLQTGAWLVANISLRRRPRSRGFPQCWDNVLYGSKSLGYVVATHQTDRAERDTSVWTWYLPLTGDPLAERRRLAALSFEECCTLVLADLARPHPDLAEHVERIDFVRWAHAMPKPRPGMFHGALARARARAAGPLPGLSFAHSELSGLALFEEAQWHGVRAAEEVLAARGVPGGVAHVSSSWLVSARFDLLVFVLPALASVGLAAISSKLALPGGDTPPWAYLAFVVLVDVAHVHATTVRVYLDRAELRRRAGLYLFVPVAGFVASCLAYQASPLTFWRALAYLAVFHFMRQQIGWLRLYRRRAGEQGRWDARLDEAALYLSMLYPVLVWHTPLPARFSWFMPGDFSSGLPPLAAEVSGVLWGVALAGFLLRQLQRRARGLPVSGGKLLLVLTTACTWWSGIVLFASDFAFTVTNVVAHGVPYAAMAYRVGHSATAARADWQGWLFARAGRYLALLAALAYVEEWLWDGAVWREHTGLFPAPALDLEAFAQVIVPLLTLPQLTHYVLDAYLWRLDGSNPGLAQSLLVSPLEPPGWSRCD